MASAAVLSLPSGAWAIKCRVNPPPASPATARSRLRCAWRHSDVPEVTDDADALALYAIDLGLVPVELTERGDLFTFAERREKCVRFVHRRFVRRVERAADAEVLSTALRVLHARFTLRCKASFASG